MRAACPTVGAPSPWNPTLSLPPQPLGRRILANPVLRLTLWEREKSPRGSRGCVSCVPAVCLFVPPSPLPTRPAAECTVQYACECMYVCRYVLYVLYVQYSTVHIQHRTACFFLSTCGHPHDDDEGSGGNEQLQGPHLCSAAGE